MKVTLVFILAFVVVAQALTDQQKKEALRKLTQACQTESGVDAEVLAKSRAGQFNDDPKLKKHIYCVSKKLGLAQDNGEINVDLLKDKLKPVSSSQDEIDQIVAKCTVVKDTPEETSYESYKCLKASKPNFLSVN